MSKPMPTPRALQIVALMSNGLTAKEIGDRLGITCRTVTNTLTINYPRIGVNKDTAAVAWYIRNVEMKGAARG